MLHVLQMCSENQAHNYVTQLKTNVIDVDILFGIQSHLTQVNFDKEKWNKNVHFTYETHLSQLFSKKCHNQWGQYLDTDLLYSYQLSKNIFIIAHVLTTFRAILVVFFYDFIETLQDYTHVTAFSLLQM